MKIEIYKMKLKPGSRARICWRAVAGNGETLARGCGGKQQGFASRKSLKKNLKAMGIDHCEQVWLEDACSVK